MVVSASLCTATLPVPVVAQTPAPPVQLPLPDAPGLPPGLDNSPNPLLDVKNRSQNADSADANLQPLSPFMPGEQVPTLPQEPPATPLTPTQKELMALAQKVAGSIISLRVWDEFGGLLTSGVGCFVSSDGLILTDANLLHPEIADRIDYITTTAANGTNHRVTGFYVADLTSGVALLQSDGPPAAPLELKTEVDFSKPLPCRVVALSDKRGLLIADAEVSLDDTLAGQGWLTLRGDDSPGGIGSPVLSSDGSVIGVVAMKTSLESWMNFALPASQAAFETQRKRPKLKLLSELPQSPKVNDVVNDPDFTNAFTFLSENNPTRATRLLLKLTKRYPRSAECWALLGLASSSLGANPDALSCQRRSVALDPASGLYWHQMAQGQNRAKSTDKSVITLDQEEYQALVQATYLDPTDRVSWLLLGTQHLKAGRLQEADEALERLTFLAPSYSQGFYLSAVAKSRLADYPAALSALDRCLQINSRLDNAWFFLGLIQDKIGDYPKAALAFQKAVRVNPDHPNAWLNLAHALRKAKRPTEASQAFREHQKRTEQRRLKQQP